MIFYFVLLNVKTTLVNARNVSRNLGLPTECSIFSCIPKRIPRSISTFYYGVFPDYEYDNSQNMKGANRDIIKRNHRKILKHFMINVLPKLNVMVKYIHFQMTKNKCRIYLNSI
ncbi:hypothetical protein CWI36_0430p0020 [Hamiltosporidium magnivora]|uniref:Uncharacterized protein n=1 Tax=Hamiltosporidium magnivora TaxID=148818 RepID=A0A4Q9LEY0_9MICR|nr:hypothetical protein CWI36_0430p0020 [Hamiltosporidium magnivora]